MFALSNRIAHVAIYKYLYEQLAQVEIIKLTIFNEVTLAEKKYH